MSIIPYIQYIKYYNNKNYFYDLNHKIAFKEFRIFVSIKCYMMKKILTLLTAFALFTACGNSEQNADDNTTAAAEIPSTEEYDPNRGLGPHTDYVYADQPDATLVAEGEKIAGSKCKSCHKITEERLVGPGWKGVTQRRTGSWLMNFITNPDPMIDKDPELQAQLELCLVRMPNQNVAEAQAKAIVEYMRNNDLTQ